ncbi:MAG: DEAD/DEAH box helicase [Anaerolineae bacterium]|jgi:ATP-dependent RNA helicase DeaD|nr:DEAD/DEAH box helicase [Anaerolineae bacterium]
MSTFAELGLSEATLKAIAELGYEEPTPIQEQTIRLMLDGGDVIAQAQTGTGKTAAFALPILEKIDLSIRAPQALILAPTRELAVQVAEAFQSYSKYHNISVLPVYGGQPIDRQLRALSRGVQVVVGTPGRIIDHMERRTINFDLVKTVVLDEADEMLNMGFIEDIEAILKATSDGRQTALFSATMPGPIVSLAKRYMHDAERVTVKAEKLAIANIRQVYYEVGKRDKFEVLARVLDYEVPTSAIIFCRTKLDVDAIGQRLNAHGHSAETLHGDLNQMQRDRVMARFRAGQIDLLIATDVAARGLDVEQISHVINYDLPVDPEVYVHRIGRTGRAGRTGIAISLVTPRERRLLQVIQRIGTTSMERATIPTIGDVVTRRHERLKETLREAISENGLDQYTRMAEEMGEEFSPTLLAAAAFKLLLGEVEIPAEDPLSQPEPVRSYEDRPYRDSDDRRSPRSGSSSGGKREPRRFDAERGMTRLYIDVGREEGVRPGDIVGAIANEAEIPGKSIGAIEIFDRFTLVDVPSNESEKVITSLKGVRIRNQPVRVTLAKPDRRKVAQPEQ